MAEVLLVLVHDQPFAVCTTEHNAVLLKNKINKRFAGAPATVADSAVLYNPKHVHAENLLEELGVERVPDGGEEEPVVTAASTGVRLAVPDAAKPAPRKTTRKR